MKKKKKYKIIYTFKRLTTINTFFFVQFLVVVLDLVHKNLEKEIIFKNFSL